MSAPISPDQVEEVLALAYEGSRLMEVRQTLLSLPIDRRREAVRRLGAMIEADKATTTAEMDGIAERLGLKRSALFRLRKRWRETNRSIDVLIPLATRAPSRSVGRGFADLVSHEAEKLLGQNDRRSNSEIAREIRELLNLPIAKTTLARIVQATRRQALQAGLPAAYGSMLIIDACAVDLPIQDGGDSEIPICCFVAERNSGFIFAAELSQAAAASKSQLAAIKSARTAIAEMKADRVLPDEQPSALKVSLAPSVRPDGSAQRLRSALEEIGPEVETYVIGERWPVERLAWTLGSKIGRLGLISNWKPGQAPKLAHRTGRSLTRSQAQDFVASEVAHHNEDALRFLRRAGFSQDDAVGEGGAMTRALAQLVDAWSPSA